MLNFPEKSAMVVQWFSNSTSVTNQLGNGGHQHHDRGGPVGELDSNKQLVLFADGHIEGSPGENAGQGVPGQILARKNRKPELTGRRFPSSNIIPRGDWRHARNANYLKSYPDRIANHESTRSQIHRFDSKSQTPTNPMKPRNSTRFPHRLSSPHPRLPH